MANLISNGVFETGTATGASQAPAGWTIVSGSPDLQTDTGFEWADLGWMPADLDAADGGGYVTLYSDANFNESLSTTLGDPVEAGVAYTFSFDFYVNDSDGSANQPGATDLIVTIGTQTLTIPIDSTGQTAPYWQSTTFSFTATDTTSDFSIATSGDPGALSLTGIALDNLALEPVPDFIVEGTGGDDLIDTDYEGDPEADRIDAGDNAAGNDDDSVEAGAGSDTVLAGAGSDTVLGGAGNDEIFGGTGDDDLRGQGGDDAIFGEAGDDTLRGGGGADALDGGAAADDLRGGAGNDTLTGAAGDDVLQGGTGDDTLFGDGGGGRWAFDVYTQDFSSADGQAFTIESGTLAGSGTQDTLDIDALGQAATGQTNPEDFGVIFTSTLFAPEAGTYRFTTTSDDGSTLRLFDSQGNPLDFTNQSGNDGPFLDNDFHQAPTERWGDVTLEAGRTYTIELRVWENAGGEVLSGTVTPPGGVAEDLGTSDLVIGPAGAPGNDSLDGGAGADLLFGGGGEDTLVAGENDTLTGGDGDDLFVLADQTEPGDGTLTITGGEGGETDGDTLQLTADVGQGDITFTNTDDAAGGLSGSFTVNDTLVTFSEIENIICFTPGARILTPRGERPVESLRPGDMIVTRDHGPQPLRWTGRRTVPGTGRFAPVRVAARVLDGARAPLTVSPQHRFLFTGYKAELLFGCDEVLVAARHLVDGQAVTQTEQAAVTYIHVMFDRHEVIYAEGAATESFHAGETGLSAIEHGARDELFALFPDLRSHPERFGPTARPCLRHHEARLLIRT